jgi:ribonucleoside-diphosphate reductase alpha chain
MATRLPTIYQDFIHISRYARYNDDIGRRETWDETVDRYISYFKNKTNNNAKVPWEELRTAIINLDVMPSMRCLMTAGPALEKDQVAGYNCSYVAIDNPKSFDEIMYILMCGTGVGFSVESKYTNKLPEVPEELHETDSTVVIADSKIGWASAYREIISLLYSGKIPKWDVSKVRPAGERLKTFGGRASGPEPLVDLIKFTLNIFMKARGRKLSTLECHDIVCKIADIVVCGGVRRSALISLTDLNDDHLRHAKSGEWWTHNGQRALANISAVYDKKVDMDTFMNEWHALYMSRSGERGIFSRAASQAVAEKNGRRDPKHEFGTNPCSEIILRPFEFCNLSEIVVRANDDVDSLKRKARLATIIGTLQSTLTDFRYINKKWKNNCDEERLLGVSLTGICDSKLLNKPSQKLADALDAIRLHCVETNKEFAEALGIPQSAAITCVKPSGTVSQLVDSASGIHPRYSQFYVRRVRADMNIVKHLTKKLMKPSITNFLRSKTLISAGWSLWKKRIRQLQQKNLHALQVYVKSKIKEKVMKNVILVGLVALGLVACGAKEEAVVVEEAAPAAEVAAPAEAPAADAAVVEAPAADAAVAEVPAAQ